MTSSTMMDRGRSGSLLLLTMTAASILLLGGSATATAEVVASGFEGQQAALLQMQKEQNQRLLDSAFTKKPTDPPSVPPTEEPTRSPTLPPTPSPTRQPTLPPTPSPTRMPTGRPTRKPVPPTRKPTRRPTRPPTKQPTRFPTLPPTPRPTRQPTLPPTPSPTRMPTGRPTRKPVPPTRKPTRRPTRPPTGRPSRAPVPATRKPTRRPTRRPTGRPTRAPVPPTRKPTRRPTQQPTKRPTPVPTFSPTPVPTHSPTFRPTPAPTISHEPSSSPSDVPSNHPTLKGAPDCGTFVTDGAELLLGPVENPRTKNSHYRCLNRDDQDPNSSWFSKSYYAPSFMFAFKLTKQCRYLVKDPTDPDFFVDPDRDEDGYVEVRDVQSWFDAAAVKFRRPGNTAYKVSGEEIMLTGFDVPDFEEDLYKTETAGTDSKWCPEDYCVKVTGKAVGVVSPNNYDVVPPVEVPGLQAAKVEPMKVEDHKETRKKRGLRSSNRKLVDPMQEQIAFSVEGTDYYSIQGQSMLNTVREDPTSKGFLEIFEDHDQVKLYTWDGAWGRHFYVPDADLVKPGTKIQFVVWSSWSIYVHYNNQRVRLNWWDNNELLLVALEDHYEAGNRQRWFVSEEDYVDSDERYEMNLLEDTGDGSAHLSDHNTDYTQYGCSTYYNTQWSYRPFDEYYDGFDPKDCHDTCKQYKYAYFGYECPMSNRVHCQCYRARWQHSDREIEVSDCNARVGRDGPKHCTGPATMDGMSLGGADIGSVYKIDYDESESEDEVAVMTAFTTFGLPSDLEEEQQHELIYAFSHKEAANDFYKMLYDAAKSNNKEYIFLTNHYQKCGCESFCLEDSPDPNHDYQPQATCYVEDVCGVNVFKIAYSDHFPDDQKPSWIDTGTTDVMEWFSACAFGQYQCEEMTADSEFELFEGIPSDSSKLIPNVFEYNTKFGKKNVYALGGKEQHGFPSSSKNDPHLFWTCPLKSDRDELKAFGNIIKETGYFKGDYKKPMSGVPIKPCEPEVIDPPDDPEFPPPIGPNCTHVNHAGYCMQLPGGTCYIREPEVNCYELDFVVQTNVSTMEFTDVQEWLKTCIVNTTECEWHSPSFGQLTYNGGPKAEPGVSHEFDSWMLELSNRKVNGKDTMKNGEMNFECKTWESAYQGKNFTDGAADRYAVFRNRYGDLFTVEDTSDDCTDEPTDQPSEAPTDSVAPSEFPTMAPTVCAESYLDSEALNIALVIDLSFSTYEKIFSSQVDIGDVNGDGRGNTILDAQIVAIQDLLVSIAESPTLNNTNTEIELISFETDATSHGVWPPLNTKLRGAGDSYNQALMDYIKGPNFRAPIRNDEKDEVFELNNGYTNFDAALDRTVEYFKSEATGGRLNLMVFLSDGEPNVRGDGDQEEYCVDETLFWNDVDTTVYKCADLGYAPGEPHTICRGNDEYCVENEPYQDCVRGPNHCFFSDAVQQYDSELNALDDMKVARLAIGVGDESNVTSGSALWMIDDNPGKDAGVLPDRVLTLEELSQALKHLCILNTDPPTASPSAHPSSQPTVSIAPSKMPTGTPSAIPTNYPSTEVPETPEPEFAIETPAPTDQPSNSPTKAPSQNPTTSPSSTPSTPLPTFYPTEFPTSSPSSQPTVAPTTQPSESPSGSFFPSTSPTDYPTKSPAPSTTPTATPTTPDPTSSPSSSPSSSPTSSPSSYPTASPSNGPTPLPSISAAPTFTLPDCYNGPKLIAKDSSQVQMCIYNPDMVQINDMNNTDVTVAINNVWTANMLPEQVQVFVHNNGIDSIMPGGDGFECMDEEGTDVDVEGDNILNIQCYQETPDAPFLAVIDVVITDAVICGSNEVSHPCFPDEPIMESCSWRLIVPCDEDEICTDEPSSSPSSSPTSSPSGSPTSSPSSSPTTSPSSSPSGSPTASPTSEPTLAPTASPTMAPTASPTTQPSASPSGSFYPSNAPTSNPTISSYPSSTPTSSPSDSHEPTLHPTAEPTVEPTLHPTAVPTAVPTVAPVAPVSPPIVQASEEDDDDRFFKPECPEDIVLIEHIGVTPYPDDGIRILSQDGTNVTVELTQSYTKSPDTIDHVFYQYKPDVFDSKCYEEEDMGGGSTIEITIECMRHSQIALLELWVADDVEKEVLSVGDNATIPECCHPDVPEGTPTTKYLIEIKCKTECPDIIQ